MIIDKKKITHRDNYDVLENALTYNIQRIENDSHQDWNFLIITDPGRLAPMRKTARQIRAFNPIPSQFGGETRNKPVHGLIEDILEKDSKESYFVQICDFISYFVHLYYKLNYQQGALPNRAARIIDNEFVSRVMATLRANGLINLEAARNNHYGLVIYPKKTPPTGHSPFQRFNVIVHALRKNVNRILQLLEESHGHREGHIRSE